jgi:putative glutamine amidotransferase
LPAQSHRPRIGVPWRTSVEEMNGRRGAYEKYLRAVRAAGGDPVEISLSLSPAEFSRKAESLGGFVLPGSPHDIEPRRFGSRGHPQDTRADKRREHTDDALLDHALATGKPVLAICYGAQSLNVHLHGTLVQDIPSEMQNPIDHDGGAHRDESLHVIRLQSARLVELAGAPTARVNSSHHQSVGKPGRGLRVSARTADGVIEALEWTAGPGWALAVQWHPERMPDDPFASAIFRRLVSEARASGKNAKARTTPAPARANTAGAGGPGRAAKRSARARKPR